MDYSDRLMANGETFSDRILALDDVNIGAADCRQAYLDDGFAHSGVRYRFRFKTEDSIPPEHIGLHHSGGGGPLRVVIRFEQLSHNRLPKLRLQSTTHVSSDEPKARPPRAGATLRDCAHFERDYTLYVRPAWLNSSVYSAIIHGLPFAYTWLRFEYACL
jgi:hypothetical protein